MKIVFFGSSDFSVKILEKLNSAGLKPALIVTEPDAPKGRGLKISSNPAKAWTEKTGIETAQPEKVPEIKEKLSALQPDLFIVASYGKILPKSILEIPKKGPLNVHASLLPKYRGASPIQSAILNDEKENGVTIMLMDEKMDHGPIIAQEKIEDAEWPMKAADFGERLAEIGGNLLLEILPDWDAGKIKPVPQDETGATYTKLIKKEDGLLNLEADPWKNWLKYNAYFGWPGSFFFVEKANKKLRVKIADAVWADGKFEIRKVVPEGKKEMSYNDFLRGFKK